MSDKLTIKNNKVLLGVDLNREFIFLSDLGIKRQNV